MGREIKRVPLDFDWPIDKIWYGYYIEKCLNDKDYASCNECRKWAKTIGLKIESYGCPNFESIIGPPKGEGYQLWETTSEGSPMSPVFETPEELAEWLEFNKTSSFGPMACNYDEWLSFIKGPGWCPSCILDNTGLHSGVCSKQSKQNLKK